MNTLHPPHITLLTDFGVRDPYVGAMKGAILRIQPNAQLVDISHQVPPQDVFHAALVLAGYYPFYPPGTVHLAVVDPGVGTSRAGLAIHAFDQFFVGPDNGVFTSVCFPGSGAVAYQLTNPNFFHAAVSRTFHGRDLFGPIAAHISRGIRLESLGPRYANPHQLHWPPPTSHSGACLGEILYVDHYGNLITNMSPSDIASDSTPENVTLQLGAFTAPLLPTYGAVELGQLVCVLGSFDRYELAINGGSAAARLDATVGTAVRLTYSDSDKSRDTYDR